jgi:quercetin dioxygenase-like cupin family protein
MKVTRLKDAEQYVAPNHYEMRSVRLQGFDTEGPQTFWTGYSRFYPGGGAGPDSSPLEKVYIVLDGQLTVKADGQEVILGPMDSCYIGGNVEREVKNNSDAIASMIVVMPYPQKSQ